MIRASALVFLAGCGDLVGFGGGAPPLTKLHLRATGDFASVRVLTSADEDLRVALVWGTQWLPEALCIVMPESAEVAAVVAAGCRNVLSFTPNRVASSIAITPNTEVEMPLFALPAADVMVGDVTARIAYGSFVIYDDRDHDGTLGLARVHQPAGDGPGPPEDPPDGPSDIVYGASFVAMTEADRRLAFREGGYTQAAFYPRRGCGDPLPGFSILSAGGFTLTAAIAATLANELPAQDPATCAEQTPDETVVDIPLRAPREVSEVACEQRQLDSTVRYLRPTDEAPDLTRRTFACASIPSFVGEPLTGVTQLVVASDPDDRCRGVSHYTLRGCDRGEIECDSPAWDLTATPPAWWPCPAGAAQ